MLGLAGARLLALTLLVLATLGTCTPLVQTSARSPRPSAYVLKGTLVSPRTVSENGRITIIGERIQSVGVDVTPGADTLVVETGGIVLPGFIDLHNHLTWNVLPRWRPNQEFANRYEWQQIPLYGVALSTPQGALFGQHHCNMNRYAEVRAIIQGETSVVGSFDPPEACIKGLARNLDAYSDLPAGERLVYKVFPLELKPDVTAQIQQSLDRKEITAFIVHLAEGKPHDASSAREFRMLAARDLLRSGVAIVHGVALKQADFKQMHDKQVALIWSPRSNLELYGGTTDIVAALREKVAIALSPDWSPTGSDGMLAELKFAATWNRGQSPQSFTSADLVRLATEAPAQIAGLGDKLGRLEAGYLADLLVIRPRPGTDTFDSIVHADPEDVMLVIIGGEPVYGDPRLMSMLLPNRPLETITVCGVDKAISFDSEQRLQGRTTGPFWQTVQTLKTALRGWGTSLAPLAYCGG